MTELEMQNQKFLDYARGGTRPDYVFIPAPNMPAKPLTFEEQHQHDTDKAINLEVRLLRQWQQSLAAGVDAKAIMQKDMEQLKAIVNEAIYYGNDVSHLPCFPRFAALSRTLGGRQ